MLTTLLATALLTALTGLRVLLLLLAGLLPALLLATLLLLAALLLAALLLAALLLAALLVLLLILIHIRTPELTIKGSPPEPTTTFAV